MSHLDRVALATLRRSLTAPPRFAWLFALLPALMAAFWLFPATAHAGTITIVDGPNTPPTGGVYTDGYIQAQLVSANLTITTTGVVTGPNEIRVLQSVVITWTSGRTLTLDAGSRVIISGTIQHNGPANGAGGVRLLTSGNPNGRVIVGAGDQTTGVAVGSRHGLTRVQAGNLTLTAGSSVTQTYAQLGYHTVDRGATYTVTGPISVTVSQNVTATAGANKFAFVQIGHGGGDPSFNLIASGNFSGPIRAVVGGDVRFQGGSEIGAYAHFGHGGQSAIGNHGSGHVLTVGGDVTFQGGGRGAAYAQFGNGGYFAGGAHSGSHSLVAGGDVAFLATGEAAYAKLGNGGDDVQGDHGDHLLHAGGDVTFQGGGSGSHAQLGNGWSGADGDTSGNHRLEAGGAVTFQARAAFAYAQFGNGGLGASGNLSGDLSLEASGDVSFIGGYSMLSYAQMGSGGPNSTGSQSGDLTLTTTGNLTLTLDGGGTEAYSMIGHGADVRIITPTLSSGSRSGDITVQVGETAVFSGSQIGHLTENGVLSVTQGNTLIGVSQNDPFTSGTGQLLVTEVISTYFASAPIANGGQLRIYLPRVDSQQVPTNASFNGENFAVAGTIPAAQLAGYAQFGDGPYIPDYSFYLGGRPDVGLTKRAAPAGLLRPNQSITYTLSFSNTGTVTATGVAIQDALPDAVVFGSVIPQPDAGVSITQSAGAPNLAWSVSALGPGKGGRIHIVGTVNNTSEVLGTTFTNTATITATHEITLNNHTASVMRSVVVGADLTITKTVVGDPPTGAWQFSGSDGIGSFTLPAGGGNQSFTGRIPTTYTITETAQTGYSVAVSCTNGASGTNSVQVTLNPGSAVGCTFTNTEQPGAVEGLVYVDENGNDQPDPGEGLAGVTVTLQSEAGVAAGLLTDTTDTTDTTDGNGEYGFGDVPAGDYTLSFAVPTGYVSIGDAPVTVEAGQTLTVPNQAAVKAPLILYLPIIRDLAPTPPTE